MTTASAVLTIPAWLVDVWRNPDKTSWDKLTGLCLAVLFDGVELLGCCVPEVERPVAVEFELEGEG